MTLKGHKQLSREDRELMARLFHLHWVLHPGKIGKLFGVHAQYVRQQYRDMALNEMACNRALFEFLAKHFNSPHL